MLAAASPEEIDPKPEDGLGSNQRRYERFAVKMDATLIQGRKTTKGRVVDVSYTGLFFTTMRPPPLRDLVKIDIQMPQGGTLRILGMAVHVVLPKKGNRRRSGVGVQLFGIGPEVRTEWDKFVNGVRYAHQKAFEDQAAPDPAITGLTPRAQGEPEAERLPTANLSPLLPSEDVDDALDALEAGQVPPTTPAPPTPAEVQIPDEGPGDVAPGPGDGLDMENMFEVAKPELRVRFATWDDIAPLRARQAQGERLFFQTEVHMEPGIELQVRVLLGDGSTAFVADGRVVESVRTSEAQGLYVILAEEDAPPSEDIYITIDLDSDWLQN